MTLDVVVHNFSIIPNVSQLLLLGIGAMSTSAMSIGSRQFNVGDDSLGFCDGADKLHGEINVDDLIEGLDGDRSPSKQS